MFVRAQNTYTIQTCLDELGVTSLVLVPLPPTSQMIEDIGPHLSGSHVGSAILVSKDEHTQVRHLLLLSAAVCLLPPQVAAVPSSSSIVVVST